MAPIQPGTDAGPIDSETAIATAYEAVMGGFEAALKTPHLPADERARLVRCYRLAATKAARPPLAPAR